MKTEYLIVDERRKRQVIEQISEVFPDVGVPVLPQALVVEAIDLCDLARFVVASKDGDARWVADLECNKEGDRLDRVVATIYVVT